MAKTRKMTMEAVIESIIYILDEIENDPDLSEVWPFECFNPVALSFLTKEGFEENHTKECLKQLANYSGLYLEYIKEDGGRIKVAPDNYSPWTQIVDDNAFVESFRRGEPIFKKMDPCKDIDPHWCMSCEKGSICAGTGS